MPASYALQPLFLCRHGQTDWNAEGRIQGQMDIPLNDRGREEARRNGQMLAEHLGSAAADLHFVASPMRRSVETMEIIRGQLGLDPSDFPRDDRLRELHFGDWQGSTLAEVEARLPGSLEVRERDKWGYRPHGAGAERYEDLAVRIAPVFEALPRLSLVVAHGGVTRTFMHLYLGIDSAEAAHMSIVQDRVLYASAAGHSWL